MLGSFARANEALHQDLEGYADALHAIVAAIPQARALCERIACEARLIQAILAFGSGPQIIEIGQIAFHLGNLWALRDDTQLRTSGFENEIQECLQHRSEAQRGLQTLTKRDSDPMSGELRLCFSNVISYLDEQLILLEACQAKIKPFSSSTDLTRKRLNLLVAAAEARIPESPERNSAIQTYRKATDLLSEWEGGVPLDERGITILEHCLDIISNSSVVFSIDSSTALVIGASVG